KAPAPDGRNRPRHRHAAGIRGQLEGQRFVRIQAQVAIDLFDGPLAARGREPPQVVVAASAAGDPLEWLYRCAEVERGSQFRGVGCGCGHGSWYLYSRSPRL